MYNCLSSQEGGTLFQLVNRRNVVKDVCNDMYATEDFFEAVGVSHVIAVMLYHLNMEEITSAPCRPLLTVDSQGSEIDLTLRSNFSYHFELHITFARMSVPNFHFTSLSR